ncbi:MAG: general secretion pathway protein GspJ [Burkholderiaceae bacterium]|jgi:general secretion pathway protein J|uniref:Prepilin-type N-terminal cleavage/methylation domain-containing protein n=1 Tax=Cupriavidus metallidurans TaxID=119219 RepID=A0A2L0XB40_9BURK|nr:MULTISPECIES: prepilin-type N-terminal cleavage/methylation domain-containing protein [Cupriavidus]PCH57492.1 MAG: general secretion pathway protein GspJ [Burkholderiaceae bacterium]AVA37331.1 prepilin-type N-terminal cleavage/methylation domain-containing protein [Cupriavidus metallidurans]KWR84576.1 general secretion pathway protein GspJ [Cupriavidus sp. SHE]QBP11340.1 prepilin-type N-terminal cleavage/methylation domain-containing protein [Cupriavidus metallidurans]QWC88414.1 prepilin-ty
MSSDRSRGFTLLEMLVAITLLAVMAVIGWRALDSMTRTRERLVDHDKRLDTLKVLYGQFQSDCEHLTLPALLQASPVELAQNQILMVRDRRDAGSPPAWQVVSYRLDGNTIVRAASRPAMSRNEVQNAIQSMRQTAATTGVQLRPLLPDAEQLSARVWVEPSGWLTDTGRIRAALQQGSAAAAVGASDAQAGLDLVAKTVAIRAVELTVLARMGDGDVPRQFQKICTTGL